MSYDSLAPREFQVWALIAQGRSNLGIAQLLGVTEGTVEQYVTRVFWKLGLFPSPGVNRRVAAARIWAG